jgi:hypothetical protein
LKAANPDNPDQYSPGKYGAAYYHCNFRNKRSLIFEENTVIREPESALQAVRAFGEEVLMKTSIHSKRPVDNYFHMHPSHAVFSLIGSFVLAVLIVLTLISSAR